MSNRSGHPRSQRQQRVGELIRHSVADVFMRGELRDPDLAGVSITVTEVTVSPDLKNATAWVMPLGGDGKQVVEDALNRCASYIRGQLSRSAALKFTPRLSFQIDPSFDNAAHVDSLLSQPSVQRDLEQDPTPSGTTSPLARRRKGNPIHGWLVLDKPLGLSSNQALGKARRLFNAAKAGHGGTLDPLASGVLPVAFGEATKLVSYAMDGSKTYAFDITWGAQTSTDDAEGETVAESDLRPTADAIEQVLPQFTGTIEQTPPAYSAIKVDGERAYKLARAGEEVDLPSRDVEIYGLRLTGSSDDTASLEVDCGKGTYVRSLARDIALALGTVGHVSALRRTRVGPFTEKDAFSLDKLELLSHSAPLENAILPLETPLDDIPEVAVMDSEAKRLRTGQAIHLPQLGEGVVLITTAGKPVALGWLEEGELRPKRVFNL